MRSRGLSEIEVARQVEKERARLRDLAVKDAEKMDLKDKHQAAMAKLRQMDTLKSALRIKEDN